MIDLVRIESWPERLGEAVLRHRCAEFRWGQHDCATLVGDVVTAMTGTDPLARFRPWAGEVTALVALRASGHRSVQSWIGGMFPPIAPGQARRGDLGYCAGEPGRLQFPAVVVGEHALSRDEHGLIVFPRSLIATAYKVG